jgi:hypothetical protein
MPLGPSKSTSEGICVADSYGGTEHQLHCILSLIVFPMRQLERYSDALSGGEDPEGLARISGPLLREGFAETTAKPLCRQNNWLILGLEGRV